MLLMLLMLLVRILCRPGVAVRRLDTVRNDKYQMLVLLSAAAVTGVTLVLCCC